MPADHAIPARPAAPRTGVRRKLGGALVVLGAVLLFSAAAYAASVVLNGWLSGKDWFLVLDGMGPAPNQGAVAVLDTPVAVEASASPTLTAQPTATPQPIPTGATPAPAAPEPSLPPTLTPKPTATPSAAPATPVRIQIADIGVDRSVVEVPLTYDADTKTWARDVSRLLGRPGQDLVGHWGGSAYPGQEGNTILVGHNFGYGYNAVFVHLGRLKPGQKILLTDSKGQTHSYSVSSVSQVPWRRKDLSELALHQAYLKVEGSERLTLVSCGGAIWAPFPVRIYVVAEPDR
jgi:LPXTG-site transpeptidase (sortase) family protein